jgi:hypothetical protein
VPGLDPQSPRVRRVRLVAGQRPGHDPLEPFPRVIQRGDLGFQRGDLRAGSVPERRHQHVLAGAEVVLQGAHRHAALGRHVGEPGGVRAAVRDDPARRLQDLGLPAPRPAPRSAGARGLQGRRSHRDRGVETPVFRPGRKRRFTSPEMSVLNGIFELSAIAKRAPALPSTEPRQGMPWLRGEPARASRAGLPGLRTANLQRDHRSRLESSSFRTMEDVKLRHSLQPGRPPRCDRVHQRRQAHRPEPVR